MAALQLEGLIEHELRLGEMILRWAAVCYLEAEKG